MEVRRRRFLVTVSSACAASASWLAVAFERTGFRRVLRGFRTPRYPGPVKPLSMRDVRKPGRWLG